MGIRVMICVREVMKNVPEISRFSGIVISIYTKTPARHHQPHFHAYYGEHAAAIAIATGEYLASSLPNAQKRAIEEWRATRLAELQANWNRLQLRQRLERISPLR
jgi:hypothetical protein